MKKITLILAMVSICIGSSFGQNEDEKTFYEIQQLLEDDPIENKEKIFIISKLMNYDQKKLLYNDYYKSGFSIAIINILPYLNIGSWANGWWGAGLIGSGGQVLGT